MNFVDTHCHIQEPTYPDPEGAYQRALDVGVSAMLCVGTDFSSSQQAILFAAAHPAAWASVGIHPHEAKEGTKALDQLTKLLAVEKEKPKSKVVAIGECGLDYFYNHSSKIDQIAVLRSQIELAIRYDKALIFHIRDAFDDFWPIFDEYKDLRGAVHSFTDSQANLDKLIERGLYMGVNGIMTFTKHAWQQSLIKTAPLDRIILETDAPFLTPVPHRGTVNEPARVLQVANFLASIRDESLEDIAAITTHNARQIFFN
jgi:TatD DNase family protein